MGTWSWRLFDLQEDRRGWGVSILSKLCIAHLVCDYTNAIKTHFENK